MINIGSALTTGDTSVFRTTVAGKVWVRLGGTVTDVDMMESLDGTTYTIFNVAGTEQTFTDDQYKLFDLPGGVFFKFTINTGTVTVDIDGGVIDIQ